MRRGRSSWPSSLLRNEVGLSPGLTSLLPCLLSVFSALPLSLFAFCLSIYLSVWLPMYVCMYIFTCLSVFVYFVYRCLSVNLSICLYFFFFVYYSLLSITSLSLPAPPPSSRRSLALLQHTTSIHHAVPPGKASSVLGSPYILFWMQLCCRFLLRATAQIYKLRSKNCL